MHKRLRALERKFDRYVRRYAALWIIIALIEERVREYTMKALDSFAAQHPRATSLRNGVLWFDSIAFGLIGNLLVLTLLFILWRSYQDTRLNT
jgi:hypothetical protein